MMNTDAAKYSLMSLGEIYILSIMSIIIQAARFYLQACDKGKAFG
ncbi:hypothetical protein NIES4071_42480 [Calothrix sp. NIES-4071]|nr:hypothetical protein NIES4071_42480 [Calothrix sp. NIES-4071]BAZ58561.1 hypothetical protein NIES4105_42400 [Calothrix sp. NIES-4105]